MEASADLYSLHWNNHTRNLKTAFDVFRCDNELVDVTLSCEGRKIKAHKIVLSACSVYFLDLFRDNPCQHPIVILRDVKYQTMLDILNFIYQGEANVAFENLDSFLKTAELLQVKGLIDLQDKNKQSTSISENETKESTIEPNNSELKFDNPVNKDFNVPLEIVSAELENNMDLEMSIKKETSDFTRINSLEYMDINIGPTYSFNENCNQYYEKENLEDRFQKTNTLNKETSFPCRFCDKVFSHPNSLKLHLPKHTGGTTCRLCHAVLSRQYELKVHMRKKHNMELY